MNVFIVIVGLSIVCAGAFFSWKDKNSGGIWATYSFGFLLVLISGPISTGLQGFSLTGEGLEVKFTELSVSTSEIENIDAITAKSIESLSLASATSPNAETVNIYTKDIVDKLIPYIRSLGFAPTQIVGSPNIRPGSVVSVSENGLSLWATQKEAFPGLETQSSSVALPTFEFSHIAQSSGSKYEFFFKCDEGAENQESSFSGLIGSWNRALSKRATSAQDIFVVQSVLICKGLRMASAQRNEVPGDQNEQNFDYRTKENIVIGYKLAQVAVGKKI